MTRLPLLAGIVVAVASGGGVSSPTTESVTLACSGAERTADDQLEIRCVLQNRLPEDILFLASDATLDGPIGGDSYIGRWCCGARYENVLQFGAAESGGLDHPTPFDPDVNLSASDLDRLERLPRGASIAVRLGTALSSVSTTTGERSTLFRLKLIFAELSKLEAVLRRTDLDRNCRDLLSKALSRSRESHASVSIGARSWETTSRRLNDSCLARVSEVFGHAESGVVELSDGVGRLRP